MFDYFLTNKGGGIIDQNLQKNVEVVYIRLVS